MVVRNQIKRLALWLSVLLSPLISSGDTSLVTAGPYSLAYADPTNGWDAPVPGFVGPAGDGQAPLADGTNAANTLNPVFTGWGAAFDANGELVDGVAYFPFETGLDGYYADGDDGTGPLDFINGVIIDPEGGDYEDIEAYGVFTCSLGDPSPAAIAVSSTPGYITSPEAIDAGESSGYITLWFAKPIHDVPGADLVVYENAFIMATDQGGAGVGGVFAELAFVEVSTDGVYFARFPSISLTQEANKPGRYGSMDPTLLYNLAGKHVNNYGESWGTPFDLSTLVAEDNVVNGRVDLDNIRFVRIVDIPGVGVLEYPSGSGVTYIAAMDSTGNVIYDPYKTTGSGGFDLDAIGAIGQAITYADWDAGRGLDSALDGDGDGVPNLLEYAFDMDPADPDESLLPRMEVVDGRPELRFRRDVRKSDIVYVIEASDSLTAPDWQVVARVEAFSDPELLLSDVEAAVSTVSRHNEASLGVWQEVCFTDKALDAARFFRVRVTTASE
jgi:hypothetical protein